MNFDMMSISQIAAFIIGLVFSVLSLGMSVFAFRFAGRVKSKAAMVTMTLIFPFIAMVGWFFLIFSFVDGFRSNDIVNVIVSIVLSAIIVFMVVIVSKALYTRYFNLTEEEMERRKAEKQAKKAAKKAEKEQKLLAYTQTEENEESEEETEVNDETQENDEIVVESEEVENKE